MINNDTINITLDKTVYKISFKDSYMQQCSIQQYNVSKESEIWFGVDTDIIGKTVNTRMHLTQKQVQNLLPYLQKFSETGEITPP